MTVWGNMKAFVIAWSQLIHLCKVCFEYSGVLLTEFIKESVPSFSTNLSTDFLKLLLTMAAMSVLGLILCKAKFIDVSK